MATYTDNYALIKPTMSELADIRTINGNMDTMDEIMHGSQVSIADAYDPTLTYDVDDLVMYDFLLYKCITAVTVPEAFDSTKWERTTAVNEGGGGSSGGGINYSTTEQNTGLKWIDGKDIYQKTISTTMPVISTDGTFVDKSLVDSDLSNVDFVVDINAIVTLENTYVRLPYFNNAGRTAKIMYNTMNSKVQLTSDGVVYSEKPVVITIQYTKQTI